MWELLGGSCGCGSLSRIDNRLRSGVAVVKHCEDITGTFVQNFEEFLNFFLVVYSSGILKMEQVVFNRYRRAVACVVLASLSNH